MIGKSALTSVIRRAAERAGFEYAPIPGNAGPRRTTQNTSLRRAADLGLRPNTIIDIGAGDGTPPLYQTFPDAHYLAVEPLAEFEPALQALVARHRGRAVIAAAGPTPGTARLHVHSDLYGSSLLLENEDSDVNGAEREVPVITVDDFAADSPGPYLLKVDVQGAELDVLRGAQSVLADTAAVILEVSLFRFFDGGADFAEVVAFMRDHDFCVYDILEAQYRPLDGALSQVDLLFVPDGSPLRAHHHYATPEQRAAQNDAMRAEIARAVNTAG